MVGEQALNRRHDAQRCKLLSRIEGHLEDDEDKEDYGKDYLTSACLGFLRTKFTCASTTIGGRRGEVGRGG